MPEVLKSFLLFAACAISLIAVLICLIHYRPYYRINVTMTAYSADVAQTDSTPNITASGTRPTPGRTVALSRDLEKKYNFKFGDMVTIQDVGTFIFEDRMNKRWTKKIDIFMASRKEAIQFGKQEGILIIKE